MPEREAKLKPPERRAKIVEILKATKSPMGRSGVKDALLQMHDIDVSYPTVSKDLETLQEAGLIVARNRLYRLATRDLTFGVEASEAVVEKQALGEFIAKEYITSYYKRVFVLGTGSTMVEVGQAIVDNCPHILHFQTNNIRAAMRLANRPNAPFIHIWGGPFESVIGCTLIEQEAMTKLANQGNKVVLMSLGSISEKGDFFASDNFQQPMKKGLIYAKAAKTIIAVDSSKIGKTGLYDIATLAEIRDLIEEGRSYVIVTNSNPPEDASVEDRVAFERTLEKLRKIKGIEVQCAS